MQLAALAAADLGLKRGREKERILRQLQGLRAGIRRVRGDDDAGLRAGPGPVPLPRTENRRRCPGTQCRSPGSGRSRRRQPRPRGTGCQAAATPRRSSPARGREDHPLPPSGSRRQLAGASASNRSHGGSGSPGCDLRGQAVSCARQYAPRVRRAPDPRRTRSPRTASPIKVLLTRGLPRQPLPERSARHGVTQRWQPTRTHATTWEGDGALGWIPCCRSVVSLDSLPQ